MPLTRLDPGPRMSQAVVANGLLFTSGHVDDTVADVAGQTTAILRKLDALLMRAGSDKSLVVSANVWLADIETFDEMNAAWEAWVDLAAPPARATVESMLAAPRYKVEIAFVAALPAT